MSCKKCGHKLILGRAWVTEIEPDEEPYEADSEEDIDIPDCSMQLDVHYCPKCEIIHDIWDESGIQLIGNAQPAVSGG